MRDVDAELEFLSACGATGIQRGVTRGNEANEPYGMAFLGTQRLLLFQRVLYDKNLSEPMKHGLAHAVFEVDNTDQVVRQLEARGVLPVWGPAELPTAFGTRRLAFFRSPSNFIFEVFEHRP